MLWRLSGDEDGPLRTSPNLSLRWFFSSPVWHRGHVGTHALVPVSLLSWHSPTLSVPACCLRMEISFSIVL